MIGSAAIKQGRSANRKQTYFFLALYVAWPLKMNIYEIIQPSVDCEMGTNIVPYIWLFFVIFC